MKYQILDMTPVGMDPFTNRPRYKFSHGLPWIKHLETEHRDPNKAFAEAQRWARDWEAKDRFCNMAHAIGVSMRADSPGTYLYRGVVSYYRANRGLV
jgi:hypothetical protein